MGISVAIMFMIIGFVAMVVKKKHSSGTYQPPDERHTIEKLRPPQRPSYRVEIPARTAPSQSESQGQTQGEKRNGAQQSAWDWMHGQRPDSEGETIMYRDIEEDWIRPVEPTVKNDLADLQESRHETVHVSVRDSVHVRHSRNDATTQPDRSHRSELVIDKSHLKQAIILGEALGEPRSKRPWKPNRNR